MARSHSPRSAHHPVSRHHRSLQMEVPLALALDRSRSVGLPRRMPPTTPLLLMTSRFRPTRVEPPIPQMAWLPDHIPGRSPHPTAMVPQAIATHGPSILPHRLQATPFQPHCHRALYPSVRPAIIWPRIVGPARMQARTTNPHLMSGTRSQRNVQEN